MAALSSDVAIARRRAVVVQVADAAVKSRFPAARDGMKSPAPGYFDTAASASSALAQRFAVIGGERRRFAVVVGELLEISIAGGLPALRLIDAELSVDAVFLVARAEFDFENETTTLELFG